MTFSPGLSQNPRFQNEKSFCTTLYFEQYEFDEIHKRIFIPAFQLDANKRIQNSSMIVLTSGFANQFQTLMGIIEELPTPNLLSLTGEFCFNQNHASGGEFVSMLKIDYFEVGGLNINYEYWQDDMLAEQLSNIFY